ncbi:SusC/RagA family TonB-linked outer membrane protein [Parapedobacter indicus]|nr:SusC/RagA family TonB-linked outer membrane protein [Parapedobacter indicus]
MKLAVFLTLITVLKVAAGGYAQTITLKAQNMTLPTAMERIQAQSGYLFFLKGEKLAKMKVTAHIKEAALPEALDLLTKDMGLEWIIKDRTIIIRSGRQRAIEKNTENLSVQERVVVGKVVDETGGPLEGVTVTVKGYATATTTDAEGNYRITLPNDGNILIFSIVGFEAHEETIGNHGRINASLKASVSDLDEVIVVGYGTQRKGDLTGAISSMTADDIKQTQVLSPDQALQGKAAGVEVTQTSGQPGASSRIRIRGGNSISAGNEPLYVIDGFPIYNNNSASNTGAGRAPSLNALAAINPSDIVSMEILKDASATAIYGSRGANGVVMITTKRGKAGVNNVAFESSFGVQKVRHTIPMLNAREYASFENEIFLYQRDILKQSNRVPVYTDEQIASLGEGTNWQNELFRTAPIQNYHIAFSGGDDNMQYALTGGYTDQQGIILNSDYKRYSTRLNLDRKVGKRVKIGNSSTLSLTTSDLAFTGAAASVQGGNTGVVGVALHFNPINPVRDPATHEYTFQDYNIGEVPGAQNRNVPFYNPVAMAMEATNQSNTFRALNNLYAEIDLMKNLTFRTSLGADYMTTKQKNYMPRSIRFAEPVGGQARMGQAQSLSWLNENTLTYKIAFGDHQLDLLGGYTAQSYRRENFWVYDEGFVNDFLEENNIGTGSRTVLLNRPSVSEWGLLSYLIRANYNLKDRYLVTVSARYDGSSRFGKDNKWGFFPSAAFAWKLSEEAFIKSLNLFSQLKLRASYGMTGNQEIGVYQSLAQLTNGVYTLDETNANGYSPVRIANPDLRWESTSQLDIGIDAGFWDGRVSLTADYYLKNTKDLLLNVQIPSSSGFTTSLQNVGSLQNKGFEFYVNTVILQGDIAWDFSVNFSTNRNRIMNLGREEQRLIYTDWNVLKGQPASLLEVGQPIGRFIGWKTNGWFLTDEEAALAPDQTPADQNPLQLGGNIRYVDINGDNVVNDEDRTVIGHALPDWTGGFSTSIGYKGFQLNTAWAFSYGNDVMNFNKLENHFGIGRYNASKNFNKRWSYMNTPEENRNATAPTVLDSRNLFSVIDYWVEDASYLRMRSVTLSYTLPQLKPPFIKSAQVYISGQNLLTFTNYTGFDPEVSLGEQDNLLLGFDYGSYPSAKTYMVGLRFDF